MHTSFFEDEAGTVDGTYTEGDSIFTEFEGNFAISAIYQANIFNNNEVEWVFFSPYETKQGQGFIIRTAENGYMIWNTDLILEE